MNRSTGDSARLGQVCFAVCSANSTCALRMSRTSGRSGRGTLFERPEIEPVSLRHLQHGGMPAGETGQALARVDMDEPWGSREEWVAALAALAAKFPRDMALAVTKTQKLRSVIIAAADLHRFGWYNNNAILRSAQCGPARAIMGQGTCANEALHRSSRNAFRQVYDVHLPTLKLKLDFFLISRQVMHDTVARVPTMRQMLPGQILVRVLGRNFIDLQSWSNYRRECLDSGVHRRVVPELSQEMKRRAAHARKWRAVSRRRVLRKQRKRTILTRPSSRPSDRRVTYLVLTDFVSLCPTGRRQCTLLVVKKDVVYLHETSSEVQ